MTWSERFRAHLEKQGLTQLDAVFSLRRARIKASPSMVSNWCRGTVPREKTRERIDKWSDGAVPANAADSAPRLRTGSDG